MADALAPRSIPHWADELATLEGVLAAHHSGYRRHRFFKASRQAARAAHRLGLHDAATAASAADVLQKFRAAGAALIGEMATTRTLRLCSVLAGLVAGLHGRLATALGLPAPTSAPAAAVDAKPAPPAKRKLAPQAASARSDAVERPAKQLRVAPAPATATDTTPTTARHATAEPTTPPPAAAASGIGANAGAGKATSGAGGKAPGTKGGKGGKGAKGSKGKKGGPAKKTSLGVGLKLLDDL